MKSSLFVLDKILHIPDQFDKDRVARFHMPLLPAFAIEYAELRVPGFIDTPEEHLLLGKGFDINGDEVLTPHYKDTFFNTPPQMIIHYHAIRDYQLLFPGLHNQDYKPKLALMYEEAEKNFESGAWLSFVLMCGSVIEGLLFDSVGKNGLGLCELTKRAYKRSYIDSHQKEVIDHLKDMRNFIHTDDEKTHYVKRAEAIDSHKVLNDLIKSFSYMAIKQSAKQD